MTASAARQKTGARYSLSINEYALTQTSVSFASFFLTVPFEEQVSTALLDASPIEMMQDYPVFVQEACPASTMTRILHPSPNTFSTIVKGKV
jgi:hypothetical protein